MTAPCSVTDFTVKYTEDFSCSAFDTDNGDWIGVNYTDPVDFLADVNRILQILQYDTEPFELSDVLSRRAISVENDTEELHLWWGGVKAHTPHSFDIYMIIT